MGDKLQFGIGINDAGYVVCKTEVILVNGVRKQKKLFKCPYFSRWYNMLMRCYSENYQKKNQTYVGCTVCNEWLVFSKFRAWMEGQDWEGKELDKDILVKGNKLYSPQTCVFVSPNVNKLLVDSGGKRGVYPIGVSFHKSEQAIRATCLDGARKQAHLGYFKTPEEAHEAWRKYKHALACKIADEQTDERVAEALRKRYSKEKWYENK